MRSTDFAWRCFASAICLIVPSAFSGCSRPNSVSAETIYTTEYGLGPDKWATAWLLSEYGSPAAELIVVSPEKAPATAIAFDSPSSSIRRIGNRSAFQVAVEQRGLRDPVIDRFAQLIYEIEVNFWASGGPAEADVIETAFRNLQYRHGRAAVTPECYVAFFDRVYRLLSSASSDRSTLRPEQLDLGCEDLQFIAGSPRDLIPEVPIVDVLSAAASGRKVVFIDVRESDEYTEAHIPGALNIPIRDVNPKLRERLDGADYVVSYCVKDFRGYEMAKAIADLGVANSVIMRPYGIKGWVALGLPVTGTKALDESKAAEAWEVCLEDAGACLQPKGNQI